MSQIRPGAVTAQEFEAAYAERSGVSVGQLHFWGRYAELCDCGDPECDGWTMGHQMEDALAENAARTWAQAGTAETSSTVVHLVINYVAEVRAGQKPWITWPDGNTPAADESVARASYRAALTSRHTGWTQFRLVKRTAVITDEVLEEGS